MLKENNTTRHLVIYSFLLTLLCFVAIACAAEQDLSIESKVDRSVISADGVMALSIVVEGPMKEIPKLKMPTLDNFNVISTSRAFNIASAKEKRKSTFRIVYLLRPVSEGKFTIGSAEVEFKGKLYITDPIEVEITPAKQKPEQPEVPGEKIPKEGGFEILI